MGGWLWSIACFIVGGPEKVWEMKCMHSNSSNYPPCNHDRPVDKRAQNINAGVLKKLVQLEKHLIPGQGNGIVGPLQQGLLDLGGACCWCPRRCQPRMA